MTEVHSHRGHCRCGEVSMVATGESDFTVYCHCDDCRRATGAPVLASVAFFKDAISWTANSSIARHTVGTATRLFCKTCGSPVAQEHASASDRTFFNIGFMDEPERFPPQYHTFANNQLNWLELHDDLKRVEKTILIETR